jgi:hypothetical protein
MRCVRVLEHSVGYQRISKARAVVPIMLGMGRKLISLILRPIIAAPAGCLRDIANFLFWLFSFGPKHSCPPRKL